LQMVGNDALDIMRKKVKDLRDIVLIPDAGHFVQMDQKAAFNQAVIGFLKSLPLK
jgi:pimeloyl-ACP methyl ester carboxylesterase